MFYGCIKAAYRTAETHAFYTGMNEPLDTILPTLFQEET